MAAKTRMAVLLSGGGRSLQNFIDLAEAGALEADIVKVVGSLTKAYGLERARAAGIDTAVVRKKDHNGVEAFSDALLAELDPASPDLIVMAGFMCLWRIPERYAGRVMNIHPALLPSFGGQGFYGDRVHRAVLEYGCKVTGCTVHFADNEYDHGPIIVQKTVPVLEGDDEHTLAARVFEAEKQAYPEAVNLFAQGRLKLEGRRVRVLEAR
jgi:formyltetrahydrofolate-dependent phosphoribosylglycinamide formyltransferase